jgi:hypothetical protein
VLVCAAVVVMRSYFENQYHDSISNAYISYQRIISLSRIMRPLGEIYKDSMKQNLLANARMTVDQRSKVNNHTSIIIPYSYSRLLVWFPQIISNFNTKANYRVSFTVQRTTSNSAGGRGNSTSSNRTSNFNNLRTNILRKLLV